MFVSLAAAHVSHGFADIQQGFMRLWNTADRNQRLAQVGCSVGLRDVLCKQIVSSHASRNVQVGADHLLICTLCSHLAGTNSSCTFSTIYIELQRNSGTCTPLHRPLRCDLAVSAVATASATLTEKRETLRALVYAYQVSESHIRINVTVYRAGDHGEGQENPKVLLRSSAC